MTDLGYYYFTEREKDTLKDFFGRDVFGGSYISTVNELTDEQIDQISDRIMPRARTSLRTVDLLTPLKKYKAVTDTEYSHLMSGSLEQQEQATRLIEYLMYKGSYGLAALYLSLLSSSETKQGLPAHYQLARELREIVLEYGASDDVETDGVLHSPVEKRESQLMPLRAAVKKLQGIKISPVAAKILANHFGLPLNETPPTDLCDLCCTWLRGKSSCDMIELVEIMVITEGVGRHTKRLCGPTATPPRDLKNFLLTLGDQWVDIAKYLGFSTEEITAISGNYPESIGKQMDPFLDEWKMPDLGQKTLPLMHKLKSLAGIVEPKRTKPERELSSRWSWIDENGTPPRRLDASPHPTSYTPAPTTTFSNHISHSPQTHHHADDYYYDYESRPFSSNTYTGHLPSGGHVRLTMIYKSRPGQDNVRNNQTFRDSYSTSQSMVNDDPVIEELSSDSEEQPNPKHRHHLLGNEITVPELSSSQSVPPLSPQISESSTSSVGNSLPCAPPSLRSQPQDLLGNEVHIQHPSSTSGGHSGGERHDYTHENSYPLGNEVTLPRMGNEVSVGIREEIGAHSKVTTTQGEKGHPGEGLGNEELLGNEVSMPRKPISKKFPESKVSDSHSLSMSLGNEAPMPATARMRSVGGVSSKSAVDHSLSLPQHFTSGGKPHLLEGDSGYTTTASTASDTPSLHSTNSSSAARRALKSDSSSDSLLNSSPSRRPGVLTPQRERESIVNLMSDSRCSSPENDLSSEEPVPSTSVHIQPPLPNVTWSHLSSTSAKSHLAGNRVVIESSKAAKGGESSRSVRTLGCRDSVVMKNNSVDLEDEEENDLDEEDEAIVPSTYTKAVPSEVDVPLDYLPPLDPHQREAVMEEENDLSAQTPEASLEVNKAVSMQINPPPDIETTSTVVDTSYYNDLSTNEGAEHNIVTSHQSRTSAPVEEYCSEYVQQAIQDIHGQDMLTALVESGADINLPFPNGSYPIHTAVFNGRHETVLFLLNKNANVKQKRNDDGKTPLHIACVQKDFQMVQILVEKGADLAAQDNQGYTCLHYRETLESLNFVQYLAHNGAPIDTPSHENYLTPLMICCYIGDEMFETAQYLIFREASVNGCRQAGMKPLITVCTEGFEVLLDLLLESNADINIQDYDGNSALLKACQGGKIGIAKKLCERRSDTNPTGANVNHSNNEGLTPIMAAVMSNHIELVNLLLTYGATVNCYKTHRLSVGGNDLVVEMSPLGFAAANGNIEMVGLLIEHRANINATTTAKAPIAIAAMCGQLAVVNQFLKLNDFVVTLHAIADPFIQAVKASQFECAQAMGERYGNLDQMHQEAVQSNMQELANTITQLKVKHLPIVPAPSQRTESVLKSSHSVPQPNLSLKPLVSDNGQSLPLQPRHSEVAVLPTNEDLNNISDEENDLDGDDEDRRPPGKNGPFDTQHNTAATFTLPPVVPPSSNGASVTVLNDATLSDVSSAPHPSSALENNSDFNNLDTGGNVNGNSSMEVNGVNEDLFASLNASEYNDLDAEDSISTVAGLDIPMHNNVEGSTSTVAELLHNSVAEVHNATSFNKTQNNFDMDDGGISSTTTVLNSFDDATTTDNNHGPMDAVQLNNNMTVDTEDSRTAMQSNNVSSSMTENNFDEVDDQVHNLTQQTATHFHQSSQPPSSLSSSYTVGSSAPSSNGVYTSESTQSPPISRKAHPSTAPAATLPHHSSDSHSLVPKHALTEDNDFSDDPKCKTDELTGRFQSTSGVTTSYVQLQREKWRASQEEAAPPAPSSAPSAPVRRGPLRATIDSSSHRSGPSIVSDGGENLFAPRPKSPPTRAPTPPPPSSYNMLNMDTNGGLQQASRGDWAEVLHDFAQFCMMAAVKTKGQEWLINKASKTGYENLTQFFLQYFYEGLESITGKLISGFIGGNPSPLNFLLAGGFIDQASFEEVAKDLGQPDFMDNLAVALHQFPGSDVVPYTGAQVAEALFNQTFSIGHRYPDPSSLRSSPTLSSASNYLSNSSFPGQGHRLGRESKEYSNLSEPAFHFSGGSTNSPQSSYASAGTTSTQDASVKDTSISEDQNHVQPHKNLPPSIPVPSTVAVSQPSTEDATLHLSSTASTSVHTPTEDNVFDEELNDLTTEDDGQNSLMHTDEHTPSLLTLPLLPRAEYTSVATSPTPPSLQFSSHTLPHLSYPLTPSPPPSLPATSTITTDVVSTPLAQPIPRATDHHTHALIPSKGIGIEELRSSLTPSPDLPDSLLQHQTPANVSTISVPVTVDTNTVSPQSSSGFQSPQSSSPAMSSRRPIKTKSRTRPLSGGSNSSRGTRPLSGGSTSSRGSQRTVSKTITTRGKDAASTKVPHTSTPGKTKTVPCPPTTSSHSKQPASKAPLATVSPSKKKIHSDPSSKPKVSITQTRTTALRSSAKITTASSSKVQLSPRMARKSPLQPPVGSSSSHTKPTKKLHEPLPTTASVPKSISRTTKSTPTTKISRGSTKQKDTNSLSATPLISKQPHDKNFESVTFEPNSGSQATSPCHSERFSNLSCVSVDDCVSFPDTPIRNSENSTMFKVLAHRIRKWKIFGRYLGLRDDELDDIERCNHFTTERCLKMLIHWGRMYNGKYSELEASLHNLMREDLIEDVRPFLPLSRSKQCSEEESDTILKFSGFILEDGLQNLQKLTKSVTNFVRRNHSNQTLILLRYSHEKLRSPIEIYIPISSTEDCDLSVIRELFFAALQHSVTTVDLTFEMCLY